jgi:hypothetical protein
MPNVALGLLHGMVLETTAPSFTGEYLYSDYAFGPKGFKSSTLNTLTKIPVLGIPAGIARVALACIHTLVHFIAGCVTFNKGHLFHAAKGICEGIRGMIEAIPIAGRVFANLYTVEPIDDEINHRSWWMIKIYNPQRPDGLDEQMDGWSYFPRCFYGK